MNCHQGSSMQTSETFSSLGAGKYPAEPAVLLNTAFGLTFSSLFSSRELGQFRDIHAQTSDS